MKSLHNIQLTDHFFFFGLAAGATQAQKRKNVGNCFSLAFVRPAKVNK